jgi:hypothetical protein
MRLSLVSWCGAALALLLLACSSEPSAEPSREHDASTPDAPNGPDGLTVPKQGFQVRSVGVEIGPGQDIEYCEIAELPGDPSDTYYVNSVELANAKFSHHLVVSTATPGSPAEARLRSFKVGDHIKCNGANYEWPEEGLVGLASSQTESITLKYPAGVGVVLHGKQRAVFDYHYVNASAQAIRAQSAFNVNVVDSTEIQHIATGFSYFNFTIDTPPRASASFTAECHFRDDLMLAGLLRHTHHQGREFSVWFSGGANDGKKIWTSQDWKHDTNFYFEQPILMKAGEGFRFKCDFDNPSDARLRYGIRGTDEMCILGGWIWPVTGKELPWQDCAVTWIDAQGIGHSAEESGGFPPASAEDAGLCLIGLGLLSFSAGSFGLAGPAADTCNHCICGSCGSVLRRCIDDPDCSALMGCFGQGCGTQDECIQTCKDEIHEHSSATGLMQQVYGCLANRCASACSPPSP